MATLRDIFRQFVGNLHWTQFRKINKIWADDVILYFNYFKNGAFLTFFAGKPEAVGCRSMVCRY